MEITPVILEATAQAEIIRSLSEKLKACYIYPDVADKMCANLKEHLVSGDYADITEGELFALALTLHLQEINHDEHLWVRWHPEPLPEEAALRDSEEWQQRGRLEAQRDHFGLHKVERLPGNIGYVDIRYFHRAEWGREAVIAAMSSLSNSDALIIDLRQCTGGYPAMVALVCSFLFGAEPVHLSSIYWRDEEITQEYWTLPDMPGERMTDVPVYVLTSRVTFSAGEACASILQARRGAILIGDPTDGGAHPGASYRIHPHFEAFIPVGRTFDPLTGEDLEGIGVTPDIPVPQEQAFTAAYSLALKSVLGRVSGSTLPASQGLAGEAQAALNDLEAGRKICPKCGYPNASEKIASE